MLLGRGSECESLDRLIDAVRGGESRSLVLRGEAGVGKTALLDYLLQHASGCRAVRVAAVESEMELAFAAPQLLSGPILDRLDRLPEPQRDALATAFGLQAGAGPPRAVADLPGLCTGCRHHLRAAQRGPPGTGCSKVTPYRIPIEEAAGNDS